MNNKLLIRIKDIYIIISRIYKSIKSDRNDNIIDFELNNKEAVDVIYYTLLKITILKIKDIK
jgi:hypothetical protein